MSSFLKVLETNTFKNKDQFDRYVWKHALNNIDLVLLHRIEQGKSISDDSIYYSVYKNMYTRMKLSADDAWDNYNTPAKADKNTLLDKLINFLIKLKK